jgi:4-hydroxy-3-polyprenylbenzoate decarboxylase
LAAKRLIVGMSGATGAIYGIRLLEVLKDLPEIETHLVISTATGQTILQETDFTLKQVEALADVNYRFGEIGASLSSGSFKTTGMVVIPCSMKTLSGIAHSFSDNLLLRAADVVLKERRKLVLVTRETPLHLGHLTEMGGIIMPPMPAFYHRPKTLEDIVNQAVNRILDQFDIDPGDDLFERWQGMTHASGSELPREAEED